MDALGVHNYGGNTEPERDPGDCGICFRRAERYREVMVEHGITSVAVSLEYDEHAQFDRAADMSVGLIEQILRQEDARDHCLYNINIPTAAFQRETEVRVVPMATVGWPAEFDRRVDPKGRRYYWAMGTPAVPVAGELTDLEAWQQGFVTLTPLRIDRTETQMLEQMRDWNLSLQPLVKRP
jgi:5'-nucleotidase